MESSEGILETDGRFSVASSGFLYVAEGTQARFGDREVTLPKSRLEGDVKGVVNGNDASYFVADGLSDGPDTLGRVVLLDDGESVTGYMVRKVEVDGEVRIYTKDNGRGYDVMPGMNRWALPLSGCQA